MIKKLLSILFILTIATTFHSTTILPMEGPITDQTCENIDHKTDEYESVDTPIDLSNDYQKAHDQTQGFSFGSAYQYSAAIEIPTDYYQGYNAYGQPCYYFYHPAQPINPFMALVENQDEHSEDDLIASLNTNFDGVDFGLIAQKNFDQYTPLHRAVDKGYIKLAGCLFDALTPANQYFALGLQDTYGNTPLHLTIHKGCYNLAFYFLNALRYRDYKTDIVQIQDSSGCALLHTVLKKLFYVDNRKLLAFALAIAPLSNCAGNYIQLSGARYSAKKYYTKFLDERFAAIAQTVDEPLKLLFTKLNAHLSLRTAAKAMRSIEEDLEKVSMNSIQSPISPSSLSQGGISDTSLSQTSHEFSSKDEEIKEDAKPSYVSMLKASGLAPRPTEAKPQIRYQVVSSSKLANTGSGKQTSSPKKKKDKKATASKPVETPDGWTVIPDTKGTSLVEKAQPKQTLPLKPATALSSKKAGTNREASAPSELKSDTRSRENIACEAKPDTAPKISAQEQLLQAVQAKNKKQFNTLLKTHSTSLSQEHRQALLASIMEHDFVEGFIAFFEKFPVKKAKKQELLEAALTEFLHRNIADQTLVNLVQDWDINGLIDGATFLPRGEQIVVSEKMPGKKRSAKDILAEKTADANFTKAIKSCCIKYFDHPNNDAVLQALEFNNIPNPMPYCGMLLTAIIEHKNIATARYFLAKTPDLNVVFGQTQEPLLIFVFQQLYAKEVSREFMHEAMELLCSQHSAKINRPNAKGLTLLHLAANVHPVDSFLRMLITKGADLAARTKQGFSPFDYSIATLTACSENAATVLLPSLHVLITANADATMHAMGKFCSMEVGSAPYNVIIKYFNKYPDVLVQWAKDNEETLMQAITSYAAGHVLEKLYEFDPKFVARVLLRSFNFTFLPDEGGELQVPANAFRLACETAKNAQTERERTEAKLYIRKLLEFASLEDWLEELHLDATEFGEYVRTDLIINSATIVRRELKDKKGKALALTKSWV